MKIRNQIKSNKKEGEDLANFSLRWERMSILKTWQRGSAHRNACENDNSGCHVSQ